MELLDDVHCTLRPNGVLLQCGAACSVCSAALMHLLQHVARPGFRIGVHVCISVRHGAMIACLHKSQDTEIACNAACAAQASM